MTNYIKANDTIDTIGGYLVVKGRNCGGLVYLDEYVIGEDGYETLSEKDRMLTLTEIGHIMKEVDGFNHNVRWAEPTLMIVDHMDRGHSWTTLEEFYDYFFCESPCENDDLINDDKAFDDYLKKFDELKDEARLCAVYGDWEGIVKVANRLAEIEESRHEFEYKEVY